MAITGDPTLNFLESLNDPAKWIRVPLAPICIPHKRVVKQPDGSELEIVVTEEDLPEIAYQLQERERKYGVLPLMTLGHRNQNDPHFKETDQPPYVGVGQGATVGRFGPDQQLAVLSTLYYKAETWDKGFGQNGTEGAKDFPFRSMDFYPGTKKVTGIALLKRDPYLPLGMVSYAAAAGGLPYDYTADPTLTEYDADLLQTSSPPPTGVVFTGQNSSATMDDERDPNAADPDQGAEQSQDDGRDAPPRHDEWRNHLEYAMKTHPVMYGMCSRYAAEQQSGDGDDEMPPEEGTPEHEDGELGDDAPPDEMPRPGEQNSVATRGGRVGQFLSPVARGVGALNQLRKGKVAAAAGDVTGIRPLAKAALGEHGYQESDMPVAYQVAFQNMQRQVKALAERDKANAAQLAAMGQEAAHKDAALLVYQLATAGVKRLITAGNIDPKKVDDLTKRLAKMPKPARAAKVREILEYEEKDDSIAYAAIGAPVGGFVGITPQAPAHGQPQFTDAHLDRAIEYMEKHPGCDWDDAKAHAIGAKA